MEPNWVELGRQLEAARGSLRANAVAEALGFSGKQLRNYERGIATSGRPGAQRVIDLAAYYGIDPQPWLDLVGYTVPRRVAGSITLSGGIARRVSEAPDTLDPIAKAGGRGEGWMPGQKARVLAALEKMQESQTAANTALAEAIAILREPDESA